MQKEISRKSASKPHLRDLKLEESLDGNIFPSHYKLSLLSYPEKNLSFLVIYDSHNMNVDKKYSQRPGFSIVAMKNDDDGFLELNQYIFGKSISELTYNLESGPIPEIKNSSRKLSELLMLLPQMDISIPYKKFEHNFYE